LDDPIVCSEIVTRLSSRLILVYWYTTCWSVTVLSCSNLCLSLATKRLL